MRGGSKPSSFKLNINNETISDPKLVSVAFNEHFTSIASKLAEEIPRVDVGPLSYAAGSENSFVWFEVSGEEVASIIRSFKSRQCPLHVIPNFVFKHCSEIISPVLAKLINCSVVSGTFPDFLKRTRVIPLFKSGGKLLLVNYRLISILPFSSKIVEKTVHSRMSKYLNKYNLLYKKPFGFRKNKSTCDAVLNFTDFVIIVSTRIKFYCPYF